MLKEAAQLAHIVNTGMRLVQAGQRAVEGDKDALGYLLQDGIHEAADLYQPGVSRLTRTLARNVADYRAGQGAIEGQYRVLDEDVGSHLPYRSFNRRIMGQRSGGHVVGGQPGSGKTTLGRAVGAMWGTTLGYHTRYINLQSDDLRDDDDTMALEEFVTLSGRVALATRAGAIGVPLDDESAPMFPLSDHPVLAFCREKYGVERAEDLADEYGRCALVMDEGSSAFTSNPKDPVRQAARWMLWNSRHVAIHMVLIAQMLSPFPKELLGQTTIWLKQPTGREWDADGYSPTAKRLWQGANEAFRGVRESAGWRLHPNVKSWVYVDSPPEGGWRGYRGLAPVPYTHGNEAA